MDVKLAWLAGIFEGEGNFGLSKSSGRRKHFTFNISITNTDLMILNECISILKENNVDVHLYKRKVYFENRKIGYNLVINGIENLIKTINVLKSYLIGQKKSQAELMLAFLNRRKSLIAGNIGYSARRIAYDEIDYSYLKAFQSLKFITKSVETCALSTYKKTIKICKVEECNVKHYSKGYCQKHYDKFRYSLGIGKDTVRATNINEIVETGRNDLSLSY